MTPEEKLNQLKKKFQDQKENILKQIVRDAPVFALAQQPGMGVQLIMGLRNTIEILKDIDEGYEFSSKELPGNDIFKFKPEYIG